MKTVLPVDNANLADDFQTCTEFQIVSGNNDELSIDLLPNSPKQDVSALMLQLVQKGVGRILAAGISAEAIGAAQASGLMVFHGASGTVADALNLIRLGILDNMAKGSSCGGGCSSGSCGGCESQDSGADTSSCGCGSNGSCCS